jgi:diadenosine tetraphosphatase ApaH/serine/threonine PP2A family protein phosphatase
VKIAVLSDIHGNLEALEAVLADVECERPARVLCLGDFVGYGASPNECIERVRPRIEAAVVGNHDCAAIGRLRLTYFNADAAEAARWTDVRLTPENRDYLLGLPFEIREPGVRYVHASPAEPEGWHYVLSPHDAAYEMEHFGEDLCLIGHSHYAGAFERGEGSVRYTRDPELRIVAGSRYLVNVGSVGQPRDGDPRAAYVVFDAAEGWLRHVRVEYDIAAAGRRIVEAGLPRFLADRLQWGE